MLRQSWRAWLRRALKCVVVGLLFGWIYGLLAPSAYPRDTRAGFGYGMLHGALMPMALPTLAMGKDVNIYASDNSGRLYKLGYIVGINLCGLAFFGSVFWRPPQRAGSDFTKSSSDKSQ